MTDSTPRIGIVGVGSIGRLHAATWQVIGCEIVAFADASPAMLDAARNELPGEAFDSGEALIASGLVDIVSICTPPAFHTDLAIAATQAGLTVLCEKPLAHTLDDALAIEQAVIASGNPFAVGFCHRFEPAIVEIKRMIDAGELGTIVTLRNRFAGHMANAEQTWFANPAISGGGALADTTIHSIDMFRYLLGDATKVVAVTASQASDLGPAMDVEDSGVMVLQNAAGAIGILEASWRTPPGEWTLTVYGTNGSVSYDYATGVVTRHPVDGEAHAIAVEPGDRFQGEFRAVVDAWRGIAAPLATVADGVAANRILAEAYASARNRDAGT